MTREEWKNYREFDRMSLEMNYGIRRRLDQAATDTVTGEAVSDKETQGPTIQG